ncbi:MAG: phosphatidate phosphatase App1 family protein [Hyphomicrobiaceae bacterium]
MTFATAATLVAMAMLLLAMALPPLPALAQAATSVSNLASDERIDFFTTGASLSSDGGAWSVPIHARVYRNVRSTVRKSALAALLKRTYGVDPDAEGRMLLDDRLNLLLSDNKGGRRLVVTLGGRDYALPASGADGHVNAMLTVPSADLAREAATGRATVTAKLEARDPRTFTGLVLLVPPEGRSVISDIDDTVKITHVTDTSRMMQATFGKPFEAVPGMARLYQSWSAAGTSIHFVSSTPWHLYGPLAAFLEENGFPAATVTLKQIRLKDTSIANILADAATTKPPGIEAVLKAYPRRTFVLVGDSGEKDPEIYAGFMRRYPARIEKIFIRNVTGAKPDDARFKAVFAGVDAARWQLFDDAAQLPTTLGR